MIQLVRASGFTESQKDLNLNACGLNQATIENIESNIVVAELKSVAFIES